VSALALKARDTSSDELAGGIDLGSGTIANLCCETEYPAQSEDGEYEYPENQNPHSRNFNTQHPDVKRLRSTLALPLRATSDVRTGCPLISASRVR
jgi:hypothetical protein